MEAIRKIVSVKNSRIEVDDLLRFDGQEVEVIIFPHNSDTNEVIPLHDTPEKAAGSLHKYANPELRKLEKYAIDIAMMEKYGNR